MKVFIANKKVPVSKNDASATGFEWLLEERLAENALCARVVGAQVELVDAAPEPGGNESPTHRLHAERLRLLRAHTRTLQRTSSVALRFLLD